MFKFFLTIMISVSFVSATQYYGKVRPFQDYVLKSEVSGKVVVSKIEKEKSMVKEDLEIIKIDTELDEIELDYLLKKAMVATELTLLKKKDYQMVKGSSSRSDFEKRQTKQLYLNAKMAEYDLKNMIEKLNTTISNKTIVLNEGMYLDKVNVVADDYVNPGTVLLSYSDISKIKLRLFVAKEDYENIENKKIYINGVENSSFSITKKALVKDSNRLSMFEIELVGSHDNLLFGDMATVEFKK